MTSLSLYWEWGRPIRHARGSSPDADREPGRSSVLADSVARNDSGILCAAVGNPRLPGLSNHPAGAPGDAASRILSIYRQGDLSWLEKLAGTFAFVIMDPGRDLALAATDRFGHVPLYWHRSAAGIAISTSLKDVVASMPTRPSLNAQALFDYAYHHVIPSPITIYQEIYKLENAQCLQAGSKVELRRRYWVPEFSESKDTSFVDLAEKTRAALRAAVERADSSSVAGTFLSGGLDSSTTTLLLSERRKPVDAFTVGFDAEGYDETEYARIAAAAAGAELHEIRATPADVAESLPGLIRSCDEPFGNSSILPAFLCARRAGSLGVKTLIAGDGGDEIFAGNERYASQRVFERYQSVPGVLRRAVLEPGVALLSRKLPISVVRKAQSYIRQANVPLPERLQAYNFLSLHPATELFDVEFLSQVDVERPLRAMREVYFELSGLTPLNRMLYLDWKLTLRDNDLVKVTSACRHAGVDVRFPFLDADVVDASCAVPSGLKMSGGELRSFYKRAFADVLPEAIIRKKKHGFGLPFGVWMRTDRALKELASDGLESMRGRGLFRREFLDSLLTLHKSVHAGYYGEFVWLVVALELWLQGTQD